MMYGAGIWNPQNCKILRNLGTWGLRVIPWRFDWFRFRGSNITWLLPRGSSAFPQNFQRLLSTKLLTVSEKVRELQKCSDHHHQTACTVHGSDIARRRQLPKSSIFFKICCSFFVRHGFEQYRYIELLLTVPPLSRSKSETLRGRF